MRGLAGEIRSRRVADRSLRLWWLGQAGFAVKTPTGRVVYIDPYLSDAAERLHGFKRLSLPAIEAAEVQADLVVLTHEHTDHLDPDALPVIARANPGCQFAAPAGCDPGLRAAGIGPERCLCLQPNQAHDLAGISLHTVPADHGDLSPTALSLVLEAGPVRIFFSGDTSWRPGLFGPLFARGLDLAIPCINGVFGNMNHIDAAMMVAQAAPRYAIPCHFWTFAEQGAGDPAGFCHACRQLAPRVRPVLLRPGEGFSLKTRSRGAQP
jgi:L-ascorbate 6-phosphate lactonase